MKFEASPPTPAIYGPITPDQANILAAGTPAESLASPEAAQIMHNLGAKSVEASDVAVVFTPAEDGAEPSYKYVSLTPKHLGDRLTKATVESLGLPDAKDAHAELMAEKEAVENVDHSEIADLLTSNVDTLLQPTTLRKLANQGLVRQKADELWTTDRGAGEKLTNNYDVAMRHIFAPEKGLEEVKTVTRKMASELMDDVQAFSGIYNNLAESLGTPSRLISQTHDQLSGAKRLAAELQDALRSGRPITEENLAQARQLKQFGYDYYDMQPRLAAESDEQVTDALTGYRRAQWLSEETQSASHRVDAVVGESLSGYVDPNELDDTVDKIVERGATSIQEHVEGCREDIEQEQKKSSDFGRQVNNLEEDSHQLFVRLSAAANDATAELPYRGLVADAAEAASRYLDMMTRGEASPMYALDFVDQVSQHLQKLERVLEDMQQVQGSVAKNASEIAQNARSLQQSDLLLVAA